MTEMYDSSNLAQMVEKQWKKWLLLTQQRTQLESQPAPTVTISRASEAAEGAHGRWRRLFLRFVRRGLAKFTLWRECRTRIHDAGEPTSPHTGRAHFSLFVQAGV
jgi:hypothetical protein